MTEQQLFNHRDAKKSLGNQGEDFVLKYERQRLSQHPQAGSIAIVGRHDVGLGYDIASFEGLTSQQHDRFIEVKTYSGEPHFFLSQSEWAAAVKHGSRYHLYLVDAAQLATPGYEPTIIQDPAHALPTNTNWSERIQQREYKLSLPTADPLPPDFDAATILVGCFKDNPHKNWILHNRCYNVRKETVPQQPQQPQLPRGSVLEDLEVISKKSSIPGAVAADEIGLGVRYLVLYNVCEPRSHRVYSVKSASVASREILRRMGYPNPRCPAYVLYHLSGVAELPALDIMNILRSYNDKVTRTSGTPIFLSGSALRRFIIDTTAARMAGTAAPKRIFTNEGKPWTSLQSQQLEVLASMRKDIATIAHTLKRTPAEIHAQLRVLGLE